jgi:hypothetical protein
MEPRGYINTMAKIEGKMLHPIFFAMDGGNGHVGSLHCPLALLRFITVYRYS